MISRYQDVKRARFLLIFSHPSIRTASFDYLNSFAKVFFSFDFGPLRCKISAPVTLSAGPKGFHGRRHHRQQYLFFPRDDSPYSLGFKKS